MVVVRFIGENQVIDKLYHIMLYPVQFAMSSDGH